MYLSLCVIVPLLCGELPHEISPEDEALLAFVQLDHFYERGLAAKLLLKANRDPESPEAGRPVPQELIDLLQSREADASPKDSKYRWLKGEEDHSYRAVISRFRRYGMIELFESENTQLLASPLTTREDLMRKCDRIIETFSQTAAVAYTKGVSKTQLIIAAGQLRKLSLDFDIEILNALSAEERSRVSKIVNYLLPDVVDDARLLNEKLPLGCSVLSGNIGNNRDREEIKNKHK